MADEEKVPQVYEEYLKICRAVKYTDAAGVPLDPAGLFAVLLARAAGGKNADVRARFGLDPAPLLAAVADLKDTLHRALRRKAARIGAGGFRFCDIWARVPNAGNAGAIPLADALARLGDMLEKHLEGGAAFVEGISAAQRLHLEGQGVDCPHCGVPVPGGPAHVYMPERFREVRPCDLPSLAHELGHAMHCDLLDKLTPGQAINAVFLETFSQLLEGIVWLELCGGAEYRDVRGDMLLDRLTEEALDLLLFPALMEFEERAIAAARRGALTPEAAEEAYLEIFTRWFGVSPKGTWFWMRTKSLYDPRCHFYELTYLLGRMVSLEMLQRIRTNGKMSREEYCKAVEDTVSADFAGYRLKQGRGSPMRQADWKELLEPVRGMFAEGNGDADD